MVKILSEDGYVVQRSKNLRGIIERVRKVGIDRAFVARDTGTGHEWLGFATFYFKDESHCGVHIGSYAEAVKWVETRAARWGIGRVDVNWEYVGFSKIIEE